MVNGTVKWFDKRKGYGFIAHEGGADIFVHYTGFADESMRTLEEGDSVCFEIVEGEKGPRADKVTLKKSPADE
jgi:CspA family cold shock protein